MVVHASNSRRGLVRGSQHLLRPRVRSPVAAATLREQLAAAAASRRPRASGCCGLARGRKRPLRPCARLPMAAATPDEAPLPDEGPPLLLPRLASMPVSVSGQNEKNRPFHPKRVLSMSRLGGAGAVAQLVAEIPVPVEGETSTCGSRQHIWEKWSNDGTERQVAKLMEEDIGAAMQFLQSKALCMMPISLAMAIYDTQHQSESKTVKPELDAPS